MLPEKPKSPEQMGRLAIAILRERLPPSWTLNDVEQDLGVADFVVEIASPDGRNSTLIIEAKRAVERRDVLGLRKRNQLLISNRPDIAEVVTAGYLSPGVREDLRERGISYIDATGNIEISLSKPGLYIRDVGAQSDPWRGTGRPRGTLKGDPAARVVRALLDNDREWKTTDLVKAARTSVGATYRVVDYLETEGLITDRTESAIFSVPNWRKLLTAWSADYNSLSVNRVTRWFEPRGLTATIDRMRGASAEIKYAVTASSAASEWAPFAPTRSLFVYTADTELAAKSWGLRRTETSANVILIEPKSSQDIAFADTSTRADGLVLAAPAQVAVDLINGPGRNPNEAEELLDWMERNESRWRRH